MLLLSSFMENETWLDVFVQSVRHNSFSQMTWFFDGVAIILHWPYS
jgi:hypothetical protein